jgi:hypothetical protein
MTEFGSITRPIKRVGGIVTNVTEWYEFGLFANDDEARGAFKLAYHQGLDGLGTSTQQWLGLDEHEFDAYMRSGQLPMRLVQPSPDAA